MTFYKPIKYGGSSNSIEWSGYGTILSEIGYSYNSKNLTCYTPSSEIKDINSRELSFYEVKLSNVQQGGSDINNLKMTFTDKSPSKDDICYLLSDENGNVISIEKSELWESVRFEEKEKKYYFGKNKINENGKSEESKSEDGSVKISFVADKTILLTEPADETDGSKMNLFKLNDVSTPSFSIPTSFIGMESAKMLYAGTTITFTFTSLSDGKKIDTQSSQIVKIEKDVLGRYKILLSNQIFIPTTTTTTRLRSLAAGDKIDSNLLIDLEWSSEGSTHISIECSGQGICDRSSGICKCYNGYSGSACQRLDCPNNCNGNGRCVALSELLSNPEIEEYKGYGNKHESTVVGGTQDQSTALFDNQVFGCLCDKRHRGYDCSLIECPSGEDPEKATNMNGESDEKRDCSGRGICDYKTGICECFDGFSGEGCQNTVQTM